MNYNSYNENEGRYYQAEVTKQQDEERRRPGRPDRPEGPGRPGFPPGGPGFPPGGPGFPPGGPEFPPGGPGFPPGGPGQFQPPRSAPPTFAPQAPAREVDPRHIRRCLFRFTFIWLRNGNSFWFYPVFVTRDTVVGFRWRRRGWEYFVLNLRRIVFFQCY